MSESVCVFDPMPVSAFVDMPDGTEHLVVYVSYLPILEALLSDDDVTGVRFCDAARPLLAKVFSSATMPQLVRLASLKTQGFEPLSTPILFDELVEAIQEAFVNAQQQRLIAEADYENALGETFAVMVNEMRVDSKGALALLSENLLSERVSLERDIAHLADAFRSSMCADTADRIARRIQNLLGNTPAYTVNGQYLSMYGAMRELTALYDELDTMDIEDEHDHDHEHDEHRHECGCSCGCDKH